MPEVEHFEIQTRRKGAWLRYIGGSKELVDGAWENFKTVHKCAARVVRFDRAFPGSRPKIIATKRAERP